jgi:Raf kinase inhibitor-like YbhB/YbcL family protein
VRTSRTSRRPRCAVVASLAIASGAGLVGCDTGDGRDLDPPVFPLPATTLPADPGAASEPSLPAEPIVAPLQLVASWRDGAAVPIRYTCDGDDLSPALTWSNVPAETVELAITVTDLDAPDFVHWIVIGIPVTTTGLVEGAPPEGSSLWPNGGGGGDYVGPCPPLGEEHRYLFTVHALNQQLEPADEMTATEVIEILNLTSIDQSSVSGTFVRAG